MTIEVHLRMNIFGKGIYKAIQVGWHSFCRFIGFWVGDGRRIRFWHDTWCADANLAFLFPELYQIVSNKNAKVNEYVEFVGMQLLSGLLRIGNWSNLIFSLRCYILLGMMWTRSIRWFGN